MQSTRQGILLTLGLVLTGCGNTGGEMVVTGHDNIVMGSAIDRVAADLASFETTPEVTDEVIRAVYDRIYLDALEGDLEASLVLLRVAGIQRGDGDE